MLVGEELTTTTRQELRMLERSFPIGRKGVEFN